MMSNIVVPDYSDENLNFLNFSFPNFLKLFSVKWVYNYLETLTYAVFEFK